MSSPRVTFAPPAILRHAPIQLLGLGAFYCVLLAVLATNFELPLFWLAVAETAVVFGLSGLAAKVVSATRVTVTSTGVEYVGWLRTMRIAYADVHEIDTSWGRFRLKARDGRVMTLSRPLQGGSQMFRHLFEEIRRVNPDVVYDEKVLSGRFIFMMLYDRRIRRLSPLFGPGALVFLCVGVPILAYAHWPMAVALIVALYAEMGCEFAMVVPRLKKQLDLSAGVWPMVDPQIDHRQTIVVTVLVIVSQIAALWLWLPSGC